MTTNEGNAFSRRRLSEGQALVWPPAWAPHRTIFSILDRGADIGGSDHQISETPL